MRPIIAMTGDALDTPSAELNLNHADFAPRDIKTAIIKAGGAPIILPFPDDVTLSAELAEAAVTTFDGLLLPGGPDVDPTLYGEEPGRNIGSVTYPKDRFEQALIKQRLQLANPSLRFAAGCRSST